MSASRAGPDPAPGTRPLIGVVHLVTTIEFGGLEKVVLDLVRRRTRETFEMHVMCLETAGALAPRFAELGIPVETIGRPGTGSGSAWSAWPCGSGRCGPRCCTRTIRGLTCTARLLPGLPVCPSSCTRNTAGTGWNAGSCG